MFHKLSWHVLILAFSVVVASCASPKPLRAIDSQAHEDLPHTALLIEYAFDIVRSDLVQKSGCDLEVHNIERDQDFEIHLPADRKLVLTEAMPGRHIVKRIYCHRRASWEFTGGVGVTLEANSGKVNHAGFIRIKDRKEDVDATLEFYNDAIPVTDSLIQLTEHWTKEDKARLVTGKTNKPIEFTKKMPRSRLRAK